MKTRKGFVSNSSSSSFIIAVRKRDVCSHCGRSDPSFLDTIRQSNDRRNVIRCEGIQAVRDEVKSGWGDVGKILGVIDQYDKPEWIVALIDLSNGDYDVREEMAFLQFSAGDLVVLQNSEDLDEN